MKTHFFTFITCNHSYSNVVTGSRHLIPERLPSARREHRQLCELLELSKQTISSISDESEHLRRLDLSKLRMDVLPEECLERLIHLEKLDVSDNYLNVEGFAQSLQNMGKLVELVAEGNQITEIPKVVRNLKTLLRLKLARNKLKSIGGMDNLKKLTLLVLDNNDIEILNKDFLQLSETVGTLPLRANNRIKVLLSDIRYMRHLRNIDVSNNQLSTLPAELFLLPRIDMLNASNNKYHKTSFSCR